MSFVILNNDDFTVHFSSIFETVFEAANACAEEVARAPFEYGARMNLLIFEVAVLQEQEQNIENLAEYAEAHILIERRGWLNMAGSRGRIEVSLPRRQNKKLRKHRKPTVVWNFQTQQRYQSEPFATMAAAANAIGRDLRDSSQPSDGNQYGLFSPETLYTETSPLPSSEHARAIITVKTRCWMSLKHDDFAGKIILPITPKQIKRIEKKRRSNTTD